MDGIAHDRPRPAEARLEQAARAAWLYYAEGRTQDEIAAQLSISRQTAQRLVSLAVAEKLVKFRFDHPIAACMELAAALTARFGLVYCDVVPAAEPESRLAAIAISGAQYLERWFAQTAPLVLGISAGRTLRAIATELSPIAAPQHKVFSVCGTMAQNGCVTSFDAVMRLAERTGAQCYPMPTPVIAASLAEREVLQTQQSFRVLQELQLQARCLILGIGPVGWRAQIHANAFVNDAELAELIEAGAVGEIAGWSFDARGRLVKARVNDRVAGLPVRADPPCAVVGVAGGADKVAAIRAALLGRLVTALITDEPTARAVLGPRQEA